MAGAGSQQGTHVSLRLGQYNTPFCTLSISTDGDGSTIEFKSQDEGKSITWMFNPDGKFRNFSVESAKPVLAVVPDPGPCDNAGVVFVCEHIKPGYTGHLFTGGGDKAAQVYVCAECARKTGLALDGRHVQFMVTELFKKAVLPNCSVIQFQEKGT